MTESANQEPRSTGRDWPLVGRDAERDRVLDLLTAAGRAAGHTAACTTGRAKFVVVEGDAGIGKTRLLTEIAEVARRHGHPVRTGCATQFQRTAPYSLVADVFAETLTGHGAADEPSWLLGVRRQQLHRAARQELAGLPWGAAALVTLDDMQWADQASLDLLVYLTSNPPDAGVVVLLGCRTRRCPPALQAALARNGGVRWSRLEPLRPADVDALLPAEPPARRRLLHQTSGGNPLYLTILAHAPDGALAEIARSPALVDGQVGAGLDRAITAELAALDPVELAVAAATALAGEDADLDMLAHVADVDLVATAAAVDALDAKDVLSSRTGRLDFRHPLVRAAAYRLAGPAWRLNAHDRAARYLRLRGASPASQAPHLVHSARLGDLDAVDVLVAAAQRMLANAPATSVRWLRTALRVLPDEPALTERRAWLRVRLAEALVLSGQLAAGQAELRDLRGLSDRARASAIRLLAVTARLLGDLPAASALARGELGRTELLNLAPPYAEPPQTGAPAARPSDSEPVDCAPPNSEPLHAEPRHAERPVSERPVGELRGPAPGRKRDQRGRVALRFELLTAELLSGRWEEAARLADTIGPASGSRHPGLRAVAATLHTLSSVPRGRLDELLDRLANARLLVDGLEDGALRDVLDVVVPLCWVELLVDQIGHARRHLERGLRLAERYGQAHVAPQLQPIRVLLFSRLGSITEAMQAAHEAEAAARSVGSTEMRAFAMAVKLRPLFCRDGPVAAANATAELDGMKRLGSHWHRLVVDTTVAEVLLDLGQVERCRDRLLPWLGEQPTRLGPLGAGSCAVLSQALLAAGDADGARRWLDRASALAATAPLAGSLGAVAGARARSLLVQGLAGPAIAPARQAAEHFESAGLPVRAAQARMILAEALLLDGQASAARRELGAAKVVLTGAGACWLAAQADRAQRRLGARLPRTAGPSAARGPLTAREREVAELVAQGMTNRAIAEELYLSPRTVDAHMARILAKLEVRSRAAVARRMSGD